MTSWDSNIDASKQSHATVATLPYTRYEPDRQPSPTVGVRKAIRTEAPVVPHCKKSATNDAVTILLYMLDEISPHFGYARIGLVSSKPQYPAVARMSPTR